MPRFIKNRNRSKGEAPGSLIHIGEQKMDKSRIRIMVYGTDTLEEKEFDTIGEALKHLRNNSPVTWLNIDGIHDKEMIEEVGHALNLHPLLLEDIMNSDHRPKYEEQDELLSVFMKFIYAGQDVNQLTSEQLTLILGAGFLITFQEKAGNHFDTVRERIRNKKGRIRNAGTDYLAYSLMDSVIDRYIEIITDIGAKIEAMEQEVIGHPSGKTGERLLYYKTEMNYLRKMVRPVHEIADKLIRTEVHLIHRKTKSYLSDFNDHVILCMETIETYLAVVNDLMSTHNANLSNRTNEIMRTLTIFASVFIPLTFIAGVYGTNFEFIPEVKWQWGYLFFWLLVVFVAAIIVLYFRRKRWF